MTGNLHKTYTRIYYELRGLMDIKKKALSDTLIKRIAGTLPSGRVLLKERRSRPAWLGSIKKMMKDYKGIGGGRISSRESIC